MSTRQPAGKLHLYFVLLMSLALTLPAMAIREITLPPKPKRVRVKTPIHYPRRLSVQKSPSSTTRGSLVKRRPTPQRIATTDSIYDVLEKTLLSVDYLEMPLEQVMADLRNQLKINIMVYWPQMRQAGFSRDDFVTLQLGRVRAETVLESVLNIVSAGKRQKLGFEVDRGIVAINLKNILFEHETVAVYYIGDLMQKRSDFLNSDLGIGNNSGSGNQSRNSTGSNRSSRTGHFGGLQEKGMGG